MKETWGVRFERALRHSWPEYVGYLGSISLALSGVVGFMVDGQDPTQHSQALVWGGCTFALGAVLVLASVVGRATVKPTYAALISQRDAATAESKSRDGTIEKILRGALASLSDELGVSNEHSRTSLYAFVDDSFVLLSRRSRNPVLVGPGRASYPHDQGAIGIAWAESKAAVLRLPEDRDDWNRNMAKYGIPESIAADMSMQCRSIVAVRVDSESSDPIAVIVFESLRPLGVKSKILDEVEKTRTWPALRSAMSHAAKDLPKVAVSLRTVQP